MKENVLHELKNLYIAIGKMIEQKFLKGDLLRNITKEFEVKGMDLRAFQLLMDDKITFEELKEEELIAIAMVSFNHLKWDSLNPTNYFSNVTLINYENKSKAEKKTTYIEFKNFKKIDTYNYRGQLTYKEIYDYMNERSFIYDYEAQRSPKYKKIGSKDGKAQRIRVSNLNIKSVEDMANLMIEKKFEDSEIILNCEMIKGKRQNFSFLEIPLYSSLVKKISERTSMEIDTINQLLIDEFRNLGNGNITIKPDYDINSESTTYVSITDGFHRCKAIILAVQRHYENTGEWLDGSIGVRLVRASKERAKKIVHQTFMRSADEPEWLNALADNSYTNFVDMVVKNSKRATIDNTMDEADATGKLLAKSFLADMVENHFKIDFTDDVDVHYDAETVGKNFDLLTGMAEKIGIEINMFKTMAYFYLAYRMARNEDISITDCLEAIEDEKFKQVSKKNITVNRFVKTICEVTFDE